MITSNLTLSHAEARANELRQRAESRTTADGMTSARSKHAPGRMRSAAIGLVGTLSWRPTSPDPLAR